MDAGIWGVIQTPTALITHLHLPNVDLANFGSSAASVKASAASLGWRGHARSVMDVVSRYVLPTH